MPLALRNTVDTLGASARLTNIRWRDVAWFIVFLSFGGLVIVYPFFAFVLFAVAATVGLCRLALVHVRRAGLDLWQVLLLISVTGYLLLNYGFENLAVHVGGFPFIISYGLMYASLTLAIYSCRHSVMMSALKEPAMLGVLALLLLALLHLVVDVPSYGIWAIRDATMCLDGVFLLLGLFWAMKSNCTVFLTKWLMALFVLNLFYSFTLPWGERIWSWSPTSGVFLQVPLLGNYHSSPLVLLWGALFCIYFGGYVFRRRGWIVPILVAAQLLGLAIVQARQMYVGLVVALIILVLLGETEKYAKLLIMLSAAVVVLLLFTTLGGLEISGRIGPVNVSFFREHIRSISGAEGTPGSTVQSRFDWYDEAFQHVRAHPLVGEGFGQPLLNYVDQDNGATVRMPHNSSLNLLARLGTSGLVIWIAFHLCLMGRFIYAIRQRRRFDKRVFEFIVCLFLFYVLFMIVSVVEGPFEFPSGAVPFYFLMGLALGLIRWQLPLEVKSERPMAAFVSSLEKARS